MNDLIFTSAISKSVFKANSLKWGLSFSHASNTFELVKRDGDYQQDNGISSMSGSLRFVFTIESDTEKAFFESIKERNSLNNIATITQPDNDTVLNIQPTQINKNIDFVKDVLSVIYTVGFITTKLPDEVDSTNSLFNGIQEKDNSTVQEAGESLEANQNVTEAFDSSLQISNFTDALNGAATHLGVLASDIETGIDAIIDEPLSAIIAYKKLVATPGILYDRIQNKIQGYQDLIESLLDIEIFPGQTNIQKANALFFAESMVAVVTSAMVASAIDASYKTSQEVIEVATILNQNYAKNRDTLDTYQEEGLFDQEGGVQQQVSFYVSDATAFLFSLVFDLKQEFIFTVETEINIIDIAAEYYPEEFAEDEISILDFIEETNDIDEEEFFAIKPGREIKVYV